MTARIATAALGVLWMCLATAAQAQYQDWEEAEDTSGTSFDPGQPPPAAGDVDPEDRDREAGDPEAGDPEGQPETAIQPTTDAGEGDETDPEGLAGTVLLWAEVATFVGSFDVAGFARIDGLHLSPRVGGSYHVTDAIRANAEVGFALWFHDQYLEAGGGTEPQDAGVAFRFGNALLSADLLGDRSAELRHRIGVGATLPLATTNDVAETGALLLALAERGAWDPWMWAPERISLVATGQLEADLAEDVVVSGDAGVGVLFHSGDGDGETVLAAQVAGNIEYRMDALALGARLTGVIADDLLPERKDFQLGLMPYGRLALAEATFVTLGFHLNLIAPFGFSFAEGNAWGLRLGVGSAL